MHKSLFKIDNAVLSIGAALMLGACGGGGDDGAGSPVGFSVSPAEKAITKKASSATDTSCYIGYAGDFLIIGGVAPYTLVNSDPDAVSLSVTTIKNRNGVFSVSFKGGVCVDPSTITIRDDLGNITSLKLTNKIEDASES